MVSNNTITCVIDEKIHEQITKMASVKNPRFNYYLPLTQLGSSTPKLINLHVDTNNVCNYTRR